jgi:type VII secretion protein EccE
VGSRRNRQQATPEDEPVAEDARARLPAQRPGARPRRFAIWWLVLLQFVLGCAGVGYVASGATRIVCWAVGGLLLLITVIPVNGRWLIQRIGGRFAVALRARGIRTQLGLAVAVGPYTITAVRGTDDSDFGVARTATTAAVAIEVRSDDLFNSDPSFRLADLVGLLTVEGVPLQAARLLTCSVPARGSQAQQQAAPGLLCRSATRYLVLSLSTETAKDELMVRGGGDAGLQQLLRRICLRGCEVLEQVGLHGQPADFVTIGRIVESSLGPVNLVGESGIEGWDSVVVGPSVSTTVAVAGAAEEVLAKISNVVPYLPADLVVMSLIATSAPGGFQAQVLVRTSTIGVDGLNTAASTRSTLLELLRQIGLTATPLDGEQIQGLRWTMPIGVAA